MKKLLFSLAAVSMLTTSVFANNNNNEKSAVNLSYESGKKVKLTVLDDEKGSIDLQVFNKVSGKRIANHNLPYAKSFALPIDMTTEDDGQYHFLIKGKDFELKQDVFLSSMSQEDVHAEINKVDNHKFNVKVFHNDVPVSVKIVDANGRIYHKYVHLKNSNFEKTIDLAKISGNKQLYISINGRKTSIYQALM